MQTSYKRFSVFLGFTLFLVVLIGNAFVIRRQVGIQIADQAWVAHSRQVLLELTQTESFLKDAETSQRGYLYTEDPKYLAPYNLAITEVDAHLDKLAQLTADNPNQVAHIAELRTLVHAKLSELAETVSLFRSGRPDQSKALVKSDKGLSLMADIRKVVSEMEQEETTLSQSRTAAYQKSIGLTIACIYVTGSIGVLGLAFLAYFILHEIQLRERHAKLIQEREEWFRVTLTSLGDAVIATDGIGKVTFLNPIAEQLMGIKHVEAQGRPIQDVFPIFNEYTHQPAENPVKKVMELGRVVGLANHTVLQRSDGTLIPIEDSAAPIRNDRNKLVGVVLVFRDATYERRSQEVLRKSEKLAAAARLAATVAHEINNPLEAIVNLIYLVKRTPGLPPTISEDLDMVEQELERVSHITRQTLGFYRESNTPGQIDIAVLVESVLKIYSNKFATKNITVERNFGECPSIRGLSGELKQVVANLVSNAADAVTEGGRIRVKLSCLEETSGTIVQVSVEDDGPGIAAEHRERIFEPFFTTKKDVGTGLGLWVTKEIVVRHGGSIQVHSRNDNGASGTVFTVHLPLTSDIQGGL